MSVATKAKLSASLVKSGSQAASRKFASPVKRRVIESRGSILLKHKRIEPTANARREISKCLPS